MPVISGDKYRRRLAGAFVSGFRIHDRRHQSHHWRFDMLVRPRDVADRMSGRQPTAKFTLPIEAARLKAREILAQFPQAGYVTVVENWRQLPDGQIEFTMRHLPTAD
jgi:hypothetical protein